MATALTESRFSALQAILVLAGTLYTFSGAALLFAPAWFFTNIGPFPPFNRHYAGDLGAFLLPLGVGLFLSARQPTRHRLFIGAAAAASLLHALNHAYDAFIDGATLTHWLSDAAPLLLFAVLFIWALRGWRS
jgi:hypothetical protein